MQLILHHYPSSNYAEKTRLMLGLKKASWCSVIIPDVMPKPDLAPLTGGYSQTPVLQIGCEVYCDTRRIADVLEARLPSPSLFPNGHGISEILQFWADHDLTLSGGRYAVGQTFEKWRPEFHADRAAMWAVPVDLDRMRRSAGRYRQQLAAQLGWLESVLGDGRPFLQGSDAGIEDLATYHVLWFIEQSGDPCTDVLVEVPGVRAWMERVKAIGHGTSQSMQASEAIEIARTSNVTTPPFVEPGNAEGLLVGDPVQIRSPLPGRPSTAGHLHVLTRQHVAIRHSNARVGEMVTHFPRIGYTVSR